MAKRRQRRAAGAGLILWGGLLTVALAGYEFWARMEVIWWALTGLYRLCMSEGVSFRRALTYFDPGMFYLVGFLGVCVVFGIVAVVLRRRPVASYFLALCACALIVTGWAWFGIFGLSIVYWISGIKLIPLIAVIAGCVVNIVQYHIGRTRARGGWGKMYEEEGVRPGTTRGREMRKAVGQSRRDKRYRDAGLPG